MRPRASRRSPGGGSAAVMVCGPALNLDGLPAADCRRDRASQPARNVLVTVSPATRTRARRNGRSTGRDRRRSPSEGQPACTRSPCSTRAPPDECRRAWRSDRKSTRLNSSHPSISYAVFCLKKKNVLVEDVVDVPGSAVAVVGRHLFFFFHATPTTELYTLSLHDALPISPRMAL